MLEFPLSMSLYLAGGALVLFLAALALRSASPSRAKVAGWLGSGLLGAALGAGLALGCVGWLGYSKSRPVVEGAEGGGGGPALGGGGGGMGMMGGMPGGMGGFGGGMGGFGGGETRRLTSLVGKLDLLSRGVSIELAPEQQDQLAKLLADLDEADELSADEADARVEALEGVLTSEQLLAVQSIDLPRARPAGGGGGEGMMAMMGGGAGGGGAGPGNENPFKQEIHAARLNNLRSRLAASHAPIVAPSDDPAGTPASDVPGEPADLAGELDEEPAEVHEESNTVPCP